jgi:hypothetical protein
MFSTLDIVDFEELGNLTKPQKENKSKKKSKKRGL